MVNGAGEVVDPRKRTVASRGRTGKGSSQSNQRSSTANIRRRRSNIGGNPRERFEHYVGLARAAASAGDAVDSENYYQHAEHYFRMMSIETK